MDDQQGTERRRRRLLLPAMVVLVAAVAAGGAQASSLAGSPTITTTISAVSDLRDGDRVTVDLHGIEDRADVLLAQCVLSDEVPEDRSCGRPAVVTPTPEGTASLALLVHSQVGTHPDATCPAPEGGRCVLRVTQAEGTVRISSVRQSAEPEDHGPPEGRRLVQDIGVTFLEPGAGPPSTDTPGTAPPGTGPPEVEGEVVVPQPLLPTAPVDAPRGTPATPPAGTEVAGVTTDGPGRTSMPETGNGQTVALALAGLLLVEAGWMAVSATRRARSGLALARHLAT